MSKTRKSIECTDTIPVKLEKRRVSSGEESPDECSGNGEKYRSFVSDCSSCDLCKATGVKSVETDCETVLQQFTESLAEIAKSRRTNDAKQIAVQCTEYVNVILFNIEWLVRERNAGLETATQLDKHLERAQCENTGLRADITNLLESNDQTKRENHRILQNHYAGEQNVLMVCRENDSFRDIVEIEKRKIQHELQELADVSTRVEKDVVEKELQWDNTNFHLQNRLARLQDDHETLRTNYQTVCNALRAGNSGDISDVEEPLDIGILEACYEAEMVMVKHAHESLISDLNKLNYKLWNEKFFTRGRLDEQIKKNEYLRNWVEALTAENATYRDEIFCLNKEIEALLDVICSKMKNKCYEKTSTRR